jgi:hypothetical protein
MQFTEAGQIGMCGENVLYRVTEAAGSASGRVILQHLATEVEPVSVLIKKAVNVIQSRAQVTRCSLF